MSGSDPTNAGPTRFGDFAPLCHQVPSYPWCNLFYRQLEHRSASVGALTGLSLPTSSAPVGINPECGIALAGTMFQGDSSKSLGNIAQMVVSGLSFFLIIGLFFAAGRRRAAVGRVEIRWLLAMYALSLPFQLLTTGAVLEQGSTALVVLTAIHAGIIAALFWALIANALVATQVVEDGTPSSLVPFGIMTVLLFVGTLYIALDTGFGFSQAFVSTPPAALHNIALFVLTSVWPGVAAIVYFVLMTYIVLAVLREARPLAYFALAFVLFVLSQLDFFLLNKVICKGANHKVDGAFVATILETASVVALYFAWRSITEESWEDEAYYYRN